MNRVYLIDSSIYIFRAFYSMPDTLVDKEGNPVNAIYGFTEFLRQVLQKISSKNIACAFDEALTTSFRNEIYPAYKAHRDPAPAELKAQMAPCREVAEAFGIACFSDERYEAVDFIGTLTEHAHARGQQVAIISGDKDLAQLLHDGDFLWDYGRNRRFDKEAIREKFGVPPEKMLDFQGLVGDAVDNIPGIRGIGPKSAAALLNHFGSLDALYENLDAVPGVKVRGAAKIAGLLRTQKESALLSRKLAEVVRDIPIGDQFDNLKWCGFRPNLQEVMDKMNFGTNLRSKIWSTEQEVLAMNY